MQKTLFVVSAEMNTEPVGIHKAILDRVRVLNTKDYKPVLLTTDFKKDYKRVERELHATGKLHLKVPILNLYNYYCEKFSSSTISPKAKEHFERNREKFEGDYWVEDGGNHARYFDNGRYVKYKRWNENGTLMVVDYFDENRVRICREEFHPDGYKAKEIIYHPSNNKRNQENYYTPDGFCYLTYWFNYTTGGQQRAFLFDPKFPKAIDFKNRAELQSYWLEELCRLEVVRPVMISDGMMISERVVNVDEKLVDKVYVIHSGHLTSPFTLGSPVRKSLQPIISAIPKGFATVVMTDAQRADLHSDIGNRGNIHVIPNMIESLGSKDVTRDDKKFVMVTRLAADKQVDHAITAMKKVVEQHPEATLAIYGDGAERDNLQKSIDDLKLSKHIQLHSYTANIDEVYGSALATISTSQFEGLSRAYQEASINGTATISYDFKYSPAEFIHHDVNGYLIEADQVEQLTEAMIAALDDPAHMAKLGAAAKAQAEIVFNEDRYKRKWLAVLEEAIHHSPKINYI
ncbi:glycosyltransferase [Kurthia zopfii]|uniref:glycosyltransferase n=1 Tax=Kurthia zopfii TaxID=1650 RepID=UPI000F6DFAA4|nr:glycosyltransferase [Kurthia zopfii]VEI05053.1 Probable poly(glycerol-phosphate) alpha-glucosyltransferase [Kurthia zopfii]